jgi:hypothetical protein
MVAMDMGLSFLDGSGANTLIPGTLAAFAVVQGQLLQVLNCHEKLGDLDAKVVDA